MLIHHNPLVIPVLHILRSQVEAISEHELIVQLESHWQQLPELSGSSQLQLFQKHFLVMNALYQLQRDLLADGFYLQISPLAIALKLVVEGDSQVLAEGGSKALADYYLDLSHLGCTSETDVSALLSQFWTRYAAADSCLDALAVLGLDADADWQQIQKRYRQQAAHLHPDRGGDAQQFMQLREAFECLRYQFKH